jgi:hypothetical protein
MFTNANTGLLRFARDDEMENARNDGVKSGLAMTGKKERGGLRRPSRAIECL